MIEQASTIRTQIMLEYNPNPTEESQNDDLPRTPEPVAIIPHEKDCKKKLRENWALCKVKTAVFEDAIKEFEYLSAEVVFDMRMSLDRKNRVMSFEELGMSDPFHPITGLIDAKIYVEHLNFNAGVYMGAVLSEIMPPKTIFIPTR